MASPSAPADPLTQKSPRPTIRDPMERVIAAALEASREAFLHEVNGLDFYLPDRDLYIEVKRFHSERIASQMAKADNVVAVQGVGAVTYLAHCIRQGAFKP